MGKKLSLCLLLVSQTLSFSIPLLPKRMVSSPTKETQKNSFRRRKAQSSLKAVQRQDSSSETDNAWIATCLVPLWLVYITNQWNRYSINYLVDFSDKASSFTAMNVDLQFNEADYGVLASVAFTSLYAFATIGAGIAADIWDRRALTVSSALVWSLATAGTAMATNYQHVFIGRLVMGVACAMSTPVAYALLIEKVPPSRSGFATSLLGSAVAVASGLGSLGLLLDAQIGWRNTLCVIAGAGFVSVVVAGVLLTTDSSPKADRATDQQAELDSSSTSDPSSILANIQCVVSNSRIQWLLLASLFRFSSGLCIGVWGTPYFRMAWGDRVRDYAIIQALIATVGATASGLAGGAIADKISSQATVDDSTTEQALGRRMWVPTVGSLLAAPFWYLAIHTTDNFSMAMFFLAVEYLVAECWFGPTISTLQATVAGQGVSGTAQGLFTLTGAIANATPSVLGFWYATASSEGSTSSLVLSDFLVGFVCVGYVSSAACFAMAAIATPQFETESSFTKQD